MSEDTGKNSLTRPLSERWGHKSNTFNLKAMLRDHWENLREKSTKKDTWRQGKVEELRQPLYSWDDGGGDGDVPCLPDLRS